MAVNVLVMSAGSIPGVAVIESLKGQCEVPVKVVAADMDPLSAGFLLADAQCSVPGARDAQFMARVRQICKEESIEIVFPIIDEELQVFADNTASFADCGVRVISNHSDVVRTAKDKLCLAKRCVELGIATPETTAPEEFDRKQLPPFPLIVKPRDGRGSQSVHRANDSVELSFYLDRVANPIVQQFVEGTEYTIDVLTDFSGRPLSLVPKERIVVKSGMQTKGRTVNDAALMGFGAMVTEKINLAPRANIQCIRDARDKIWLIEVNPKFSASLPFTIAAGVNGPLLLLKLHLGQHVEPIIGKFADNLLMLRVWRELYRQM